MITEWRNPRLVSQYSESNAETIHIKWDDSNGYAGLRSSNGSSVGTLGKLIHIARSPKPDIVNKTYYIKMTNYSFTNLSNTINGIELKLLSKRVGRITDDTVSLTYNNQLIGENQARLEINPTMYYGGPLLLWGVSNITKQIIEDPSFGVVLRFKSHPEWPHSDPMDLISVQLRIH
jgi:hypothetical protein